MEGSNNMLDYDLIIIGAGIAGMTAALGAAESGLKKILLIEREEDIGGYKSIYS